MTVMESIRCLDQLIDESDPDVDFANSYHAFQTAEGIRKEHPDKGEEWAWPSTESLCLQSVIKIISLIKMNNRIKAAVSYFL